MGNFFIVARRSLRKTLAVCGFLVFGYSSPCQDKGIEIISPSGTNARVGKWEKLELGLNISRELFLKLNNAINPFDPDELSIEAVFESAGGNPVQHTVYGFYYDEFTRRQEGDQWSWVPKRNKYPLRVRFAPDKLGTWSCAVKVVVNKTETIDLGKIGFECVESGSAGEVQLMNTTDARNRYLRFSDKNEMFFPVGLNLVWTRLDALQPQDYLTYERWIEQLEQAGANYIQLSMLPFTHGIEQEELNNYQGRMAHAWEMDQLVEQAHRKGIYINLLTLIHDEFLTGQGWIHKNNHWSNNIYNRSRNNQKTGAGNPADFFTDTQSKAAFKNRLRYILSRFGYSVNLPVIELLSEVDNAIPGYNDKTAQGDLIRKRFLEWFVEMRDYIQKDLGYKKLVSASYTQGDQMEDIEDRIFSVSDVVLLHFYGRDRFTNYKNRYMENVNVFKAHPLTRYKPVIFDEMGASVFPGPDKCSDITFHNSIWATAFMGCFGTGQNWWWDNAILPNGYERNFTGIRKFLSGENYTVTGFTGGALADNGRKFKNKTRYEVYYLRANDNTKATGWLHNTSFYWANLKESNPCIAKLIEDNNGASVDPADNTEYKKEYEKRGARGTPQVKRGYKLLLKLAPRTAYIIKWYNTVTGEPTGLTQTVTSSSSGKVKFDIPEIIYPDNPYGDLGFKIVRFSK